MYVFFYFGCLATVLFEGFSEQGSIKGDTMLTQRRRDVFVIGTCQPTFTSTGLLTLLATPVRTFID